MNRRISQIACVVAAGILLAGCTTAPDSDPKEPEKTPAAPAAEEPKAENDFTVQPGTAGDEYVGALQDVIVGTCDSSDGGTKIAGTVTNPTEGSVDYRIYVSIMSDGDTLGIVQSDVADLAGGDTAEWEKDAAAGAPDATCVLRVERASGE